MPEYNLDTQSQADLERRVDVGSRCIALAYDGPQSRLEAEFVQKAMEFNDRETYARDAVADILTALFGPAGTAWPSGAFTLNGDAGAAASAFLASAFESWQGDAEDYTREDTATDPDAGIEPYDPDRIVANDPKELGGDVGEPTAPLQFDAGAQGV